MYVHQEIHYANQNEKSGRIVCHEKLKSNNAGEDNYEQLKFFPKCSQKLQNSWPVCIGLYINSVF